MRSRSLGLAVLALALAPAAAAQVGQKPPELDAVQWYNSAPLTLDRLAGKAVLVEVFRTW